MTGQAEKWGCPNWWDKDVYPVIGDGDFEAWEWKWEFLRRLPEYRRLYQRILERPGVDTTAGGIIRWKEDAFLSREFSLEKPPDPRLKLNKNPFYVVGGFLWGAPSRKWLMEKLNQPPPDHLPDPKNYVKEYAEWLFNILYYDGATLETEDKNAPKIAMIRFNLTKPIGPQLEFAKKILEREVNEQNLSSPIPKFAGRARESWQMHLRVIDAKEQGASHQEIYAQFAEELVGEDDDALDDFYREGRQPKAIVSRWHKQAVDAMEKIARLLE